MGASTEWRLTQALGFELDAMFHRMGYVAIVNSFNSVTGNFRDSAVDVKGDSWDFPLMAKYRFGRSVRPYIVGGGVGRARVLPEFRYSRWTANISDPGGFASPPTILRCEVEPPEFRNLSAAVSYAETEAKRAERKLRLTVC